MLVTWRPGRSETAESAIRLPIQEFTVSIPGVVGVTEGRSTSPEGLEGGHEYGFVVTFESPTARNAYLDDPHHRPVAEVIRAESSNVVVFDI